MTAACSLPERLAVLLAKEFSDGEVGFTGLGTGRAAAVYITGIPLAAMALAQRTHAPSLTVLLAGWSHNPDLSQLHGLPELEFDERLRAGVANIHAAQGELVDLALADVIDGLEQEGGWRHRP